ncbi:MAG TPA: membrane-associated protein, partial [Thermoanaerobaculia bacterium]|nr:membrane-associated protein [Thermoanaerobaculia bacterium]
MSRIPVVVKVLYLLWLAVWVPVYWQHNGVVNFLWFCDLANFLVGLGLVLESSLLLSSQAVGVLLIQVVWVFDFAGRLLFGRHPLGATRYMFELDTPLFVRLFSLFHVVMPVLLLWGLKRLGYNPGAFRLQTAIAWVVLPLSFWLGEPAANLNWLYRPFEQPQPWLPPTLYLLFCMAAYP